MKKITLNSKELALLTKVSKNSITGATQILNGNLCVTNFDEHIEFPIKTENTYALPVKWSKDVFIDNEGRLCTGIIKMKPINDYAEGDTIKFNINQDKIDLSFEFKPTFNNFADDDELRLAMCNLNLNPKLGEISATNGHKLCVEHIQPHPTFDKDILIPLVNYPIYDVDCFQYSDSSMYLKFKLESVVLWKRSCDERFPDYRSVIPIKEKSIYTFTINVDKYIEMTKSLIKTSTNQIQFTNKSLIIFSDIDHDINASFEDVFTIDGPMKSDFGLNWVYLLDVIKVGKSNGMKEMKFYSQGPSKAMLFNNGTLEILLMPIMLDTDL